jgi:hypothetical protein
MPATSAHAHAFFAPIVILQLLLSIVGWGYVATRLSCR